MIVDGGTFNWSREGRYPMLSEPRPEYSASCCTKLRQFRFRHRLPRARLARSRPALSPFNAFLILTGIETLPLRMQRHSDNALAVAEWLSKHPEIAWVSYPGLAGDKYHTLAKKYVPKAVAPVFTIGLKGGYDAGVRLVSNVELFSLSPISATRAR